LKGRLGEAQQGVKANDLIGQIVVSSPTSLQDERSS
jgi:hypothetical protein